MSSQSATPATTSPAEQLPTPAQVVAAVAASASLSQVPVEMAPPANAVAQYGSLSAAEGRCDLLYAGSTAPRCFFGDLKSSTTIVLWGDSHGAMWMPAFEAVATHLGYRLAVFTKSACPPLIGVEPWPSQINRPYTECEGFKKAVLAEIKTLHPAKIILTGAFRGFDYTMNGTKVAGGTYLEDNQWIPTSAVQSVWDRGLATTLRDLKSTGAKLVVLGDIAYPKSDGAQCISAHQNNLTACRWIPKLARFAVHNRDEKMTARADGASYASTTQWFCTATVCDPVVGKIAVYRDSYHITRQYSLWLADAVGQAVGLLK
jgi:hypothetical protein